MSKNLVVIGFAEALAAPEAAWSLLDSGYQVVVIARTGRQSPLRHSRFVEVMEITAPETNFEQSAFELQAVLSSLRCQLEGQLGVLVPLDDIAVRLMCGLDLDRTEWREAGPRGYCAEIALNKRLQVETAKASGLAVPRSWFLEGIEDASELRRTANFPLVLKSADCAPVVSGKVQKGRNFICADMDELDAALDIWDRSSGLLAQEFIGGTGEGVFGIATEAGVRAWSGHRRLRMMNPHGSGSSACVSLEVLAEVRAQVSQLISLIGWRGLFMVEFLRDPSGKLWFIELNGRAWGSTALSRRQGLEYPAWNVELMLKNDFAGDESAVAPGVVCRHFGRELMHLLFVLRGPKSRALSAWPSIWKSALVVMRIGKNDRMYNWRRQDPMVFLADFYYTLHDNMLKPRRTA